MALKRMQENAHKPKISYNKKCKSVKLTKKTQKCVRKTDKSSHMRHTSGKSIKLRKNPQKDGPKIAKLYSLQKLPTILGL